MKRSEAHPGPPKVISKPTNFFALCLCVGRILTTFDIIQPEELKKIGAVSGKYELQIDFILSPPTITMPTKNVNSPAKSVFVQCIQNMHYSYLANHVDILPRMTRIYRRVLHNQYLFFFLLFW